MSSVMEDICNYLARAGKRSGNPSITEEKEMRDPLLNGATELGPSAARDDMIESLSSSTQFKTTRASAWAPVSSFEESFNPSIEGLRGIAVSLTMTCHVIVAQNLRSAAGTMGVTIFFVLSGFLITAVLIRLQSKASSKYGYLSRFYFDRIVRLCPALFLLIGGTYVYYWQRERDMASFNRYAVLALCYMSNWKSLWYTTDYTGPWGNTWSLACEEQFYILWSVALPIILARSHRMRTVIMVSSITFLVFLRIWTSMYPGSFWGADWRYGLWANMWKMLVGASIRIIPSPPWLLNRLFAYVGLLGMFCTLVASNLPQPHYESVAPGWKNYLGPIQGWTDLLSAIFTVLILYGISGVHGGIMILELHFVRFIGRISYAFYLWQVPILTISGWRKIYPAFADTAVAFVVAMCSTIYVEEPIRRFYKKQMGPRPRVASTSPA